MSASVRKLAKQTLVYGLSSIVPRFLNFLLVPLYTYYFKPAEYGVVADLYSWAVLLNILLTYGMETSVFRFSKGGNSVKSLSTAFYSIFSTSLIFLLLVFLFSSKLSSYLGYSSNPQYVLYFAWIIFFDSLSAILFVKLRLQEKALLFSLLKILNVIVNILLNVLFIILLPYFSQKQVLNFNLTVDYIFIANLLASFSTLLTLFRHIPSPVYFSFNFLTNMLRYGIPLMLSGIVGAINDVIDRQFIKYLSPKGVDSLDSMGIYFANLKLAVILLLFIQAFRYAAEPFFFRHADEKEGREMFARIGLYYLVVSMLVFLFTFANLPVFKFFIGSEYWRGLHIVPVVLLANVFSGLYLNFSMWYKLADKTSFGLYIMLIGCFFTVVFDFIFVPVYGYTAAAYVRLFSYVIMTFICLLYGQKFYKIPYRLMTMLKYFIIALAVYTIQQFLGKLIDVPYLLIANNALLVVYLFYIFISEKLFNSFKWSLWSIKSRLKF
ncbi:MAG: oligosaccharide flippase family protein [Bacteroidales bacterium]|nr:oligosaccharide flippase family protein [Bacteroidales bacterium]